MDRAPRCGSSPDGDWRALHCPEPAAPSVGMTGDIPDASGSESTSTSAFGPPRRGPFLARRVQGFSSEYRVVAPDRTLGRARRSAAGRREPDGGLEATVVWYPSHSGWGDYLSWAVGAQAPGRGGLSLPDAGQTGFAGPTSTGSTGSVPIRGWILADYLSVVSHVAIQKTWRDRASAGNPQTCSERRSGAYRGDRAWSVARVVVSSVPTRTTTIVLVHGVHGESGLRHGGEGVGPPNRQSRSARGRGRVAVDFLDDVVGVPDDDASDHGNRRPPWPKQRRPVPVSDPRNWRPVRARLRGSERSRRSPGRRGP